MSEQPSVAQDIRDVLLASRTEIEALELEVEGLRQSIEQVKDHARQVVSDHLPEISNPDEQLDLASEIYWFWDDLIAAWAIAPALNTRAANVYQVVNPVAARCICARCGAESEMTFNSRSSLQTYRPELRDKGYITRNWCDACLAKSEQQRREQQEAYDREILRLRTMPYRDYLQTEHWLDLRRRMLKRADYRCQVCNRNNQGLQVHHRTYERRGHEEYGDLIVLCATCHQTFHENGKLAK